MTLPEKILNLYPELTWNDFGNSILLQNDSDGRGDYIAAWNHPTLPRPTDEQFAALDAPVLEEPTDPVENTDGA